jgi:hypothetical protein
VAAHKAATARVLVAAEDGGLGRTRAETWTAFVAPLGPPFMGGQGP